MTPKTQQEMVEVAKRLLANIDSIEHAGLHSYEKVMDLPKNWYDIEIFKEALSKAKYLGAETFNVKGVGEQGFFKSVPIKSIIKKDLSLLHELLNKEDENPV